MNNYCNKSFGQNKYQNPDTSVHSVQTTPTDTFINYAQKQEEVDTKGNWTKRNLGGDTASIPLVLAYVYDFLQICKIVGAKKSSKISFNQILKKSLKNSAIVTIIGGIATFALNNYFNSKTDKNYATLTQKFDKINTDTNAELAEETIYSNFAEALYNPMSGKIQFSKNAINDPIHNKNIEKKIKHELVHAMQYETVARSEDGIKKVNFAVMNQLKKNIEKMHGKEYFDLIYNDIINNGDKYENTKIRIMGGCAEVNLKDYICAIHTMLNKPDAGYEDIPIVINSEHYQKVIDEKGALTSEEEIKAGEYYKAMLDYPPINFWATINPWSSYRQNLLEKEAYKENPSLMTKLSYSF